MLCGGIDPAVAYRGTPPSLPCLASGQPNMDEDDERILRSSHLQRAAALSSGADHPWQGGSKFAQQILAKSANLRSSNSHEWAEVQKAAFEDWINSTLRARDLRVEENLFEELKVCQ